MCWPTFRPSSAPASSPTIKTIFAQETAQDLRTQWKIVANGLRERVPKLASLMDEARDDVLAYTAFPKEHWPQIASTNRPRSPSTGWRRLLSVQTAYRASFLKVN